MHRQDLERMTREQLIEHAERLGISRPRVLTQPELVDEIIGRTTKDEPERARARGWLGRARDLLARVVERGLHLPEAARVLRKQGEKGGWRPPPPPLPTVTLAEIYAAQGHLERALAVLDEVIAREPDHREAKAMRERFAEQAQRSRARSGRDREQPPATTAAPASDPVSTPPAEHVEAAPPAPTPPVERRDEPAHPQVEAAPAKAEPPPTPPLAPVVIATPAQAQEPSPPVLHDEPPPTSREPRPAAPSSPAVSAADLEVPSTERAPGRDEVAEPPPPPPVVKPPPEPAAPGLPGPAPAALLPLEEPPLPDRYEVDEIVAIAVDPRTIYLYWEVRPRTLAHARARRPNGALCVRVVSVIASWEGPVVDTRDLHVDALYGDRFLRDVQPGSNVRVSVGWLDGDAAGGHDRGHPQAGFEPFAVGAEVTAPRAVPVESVAQEVARWEAEPVVAPFQSRRVEAPAMAPGFGAPPFARGAPPGRSGPFASASLARRGAAQGGPVDTGVTTWGAPRGEAVAPHETGYDETLSVEAVPPYEEAYDEGIIVEDAPGWYEPGGSSELGRGGPGRRMRPGRGRRLVPGVPGVPRVPSGDRAGERGGASELSPGGASELSF